MRLFQLFTLAILTLECATASAQTVDPPAIVAVIEGGRGIVDPDLVRTRVGTALGVPVVSMIEAGPTGHALLAIAVTHGGRRAAIRYVPADGVRYAVLVDIGIRGRRDGRGAWLVEACVSAVRTSEARRASTSPGPDIVDPWVASHLAREDAHSRADVDPWEGLPRLAPGVWVLDYFVGDDVEDPWARAVETYRSERGRESPTRPGAARSR